MSITTNGVYEGGVVKIGQALGLREGTPVRVVVTPLEEALADPLAGVIGTCPSAGDMGLSERHDELLYGRSESERIP